MALVLEKKEQSFCSIYALTDPRAGTVRYVGKSTDAGKRYRSHIKTARDGGREHRSCWIRSLLASGIRPGLEVLEVCSTNEWKDRERYWIAELRGSGAALTNHTEGGDGVEMDDACRQRISVGRRGKPAHNKGKSTPADVRERQSLAAIAKFKRSPELRAKIARQRSNLNSEEVLEIWRLANDGGVPQQRIAEIYHTDASTVSEIKNGKRFQYFGLPLTSIDVKAKRRHEKVLIAGQVLGNGGTVHDVAEALGVCLERACDYAREATGNRLVGIRSSKARQHESDVRRMKDSGFTNREIAGALGITPCGVWRILKRING